MTLKELISYIDHTGLGPTLGLEQVEKLCREAVSHGFCSVCIPEKYTAECARLLKGSSVKTCTVIGFPHGADSTISKCAAAASAVKAGAEEVDMVISVADALGGHWQSIQNEISEIKKITGKAVLKVIVETCYLNRKQKEEVCKTVLASGADFIKTSTGFGTGGASEEDIRLFAGILRGSSVKIKASGGIRDYASASKMIEAGASRLGCSAGVAIVTDQKAVGQGY